MAEQSDNRINRRDLFRFAGAAVAVSVLAGCGPTATPTTAPVPTQPKAAAPTAGTAPAAVATRPPTAPGEQLVTADVIPTPRVGPNAATFNWDMYPKEDPRHWLVDKMIPPPKKYEGLVTTQNYDLGDAVFKDGEAVDDNVKTRWLKDQMGLTYKAAWSGQAVNYWTTALASGDVSELITNVPQTAYLQLREADKLADITDIWEKTASALTKKKKRYPDFLWWKVYNEKGRYFGIPSNGAGAYNSETGIWVRKDWLAKVNLPVPDTLDQLYQVGMAFVKAGLSKQGMWIGYPAATPYWGQGTLDFVFGAYGTLPRIWRKGSDGKLTWSSLEPAQKDALGLCAKWYQDGMFDPEYLAQNDANKFVGGNMFGMCSGRWPMSVSTMRTSVANDKTADWIYTTIPAGPGGKRGRWGDPMVAQTTCFRKGIDPVKIEAVINTLNWWYEIEDANITATTGGTLVFSGYDYVEEGGKLVNGKNGTSRYNPGGLTFTLKGYPEFDHLGYNRGALQYKMDKSLLNPLQLLWAQDVGQVMGAQAINVNFSMLKYRIVTDFVWPVPTSVLELSQALTKLEDQAYADIITGKQPVSSWDTFAQNWVKQGGDRLTTAINAEAAKRA